MTIVKYIMSHFTMLTCCATSHFVYRRKPSKQSRVRMEKKKLSELVSDSDEESGSKVDNSLLNQITVAQLVPFTLINTYYQICQPI